MGLLRFLLTGIVDKERSVVREVHFLDLRVIGPGKDAAAKCRADCLCLSP